MNTVLEGFLFCVCVVCLVVFIATISGCRSTDVRYNSLESHVKGVTCVKDGKQLRCDE